jgi:hypothetical protein
VCVEVTLTYMADDYRDQYIPDMTLTGMPERAYRGRVAPPKLVPAPAHAPAPSSLTPPTIINNYISGGYPGSPGWSEHMTATPLGGVSRAGSRVGSRTEPKNKSAAREKKKRASGVKELFVGDSENMLIVLLFIAFIFTVVYFSITIGRLQAQITNMRGGTFMELPPGGYDNAAVYTSTN